QLLSQLSIHNINGLAAAAAVAEFVTLECAPCRENFSKEGLVFTSGYSTDPYSLISQAPLDGPADLKGKKFRSAGGVWDRWSHYVGGAAVNMSIAEAFQAIDRGAVDIVIFSPSGLESYSLWDVANYVTLLPLGSYAAMSNFTMSKRF